MEYQTVVGANSKELFDNTLFREKCEINDTDKSIIAVSAKSTLEGKECLAGEVRVTVKTIFRCVFVNEEGVFSNEKIETESVQIIKNEFILPSTSVSIKVDIVGTSFSGRTCNADIEISGWFIREKEITFLNACIPQSFCKTCAVGVDNSLFLQGELSLALTDETKMNIQSLLDYSTNAVVRNIFCADGSYRIEGDVFIRILAQEEGGQCFSQEFTHPFSTEISDINVTQNAEPDIEVEIKESILSLGDGDRRMLICDIGLSFSGVLYVQKEIESVVDTYSLTHELILTKSQEKITSGFCLRSMHEKAMTKVTPKEGLSEFIGVFYPAVSTSIVKSNGNVTAVEGILQTEVLYKNSQDKIASVGVEIPYQVFLPVDFGCDVKLIPSVIVTEIGGRTRSGGEIDITSELLVTVRGVNEKTIEVISNVEKGEEKEEDDIAVSLYIVRQKESLWDVAKALNTSEETLSSQNPDLLLPLKGDERIILYRELPFEE